MSNAPPSRTISWRQIVQEADPDFTKRLYRPIIYEFSNGRTFEKDPSVYTD